MTESVAQCTFVLTKSTFLEGMRCTQKDALGKTMRWVFLVLVVLWLAISVLSIAANGGVGLALSELVVLIALIVYVAIWLPYSRAARAWKNMEASGQADSERTIRFFTDHLQLELPGQQKEIAYAEVIKSLESRNLLILICDNRAGIMIRKENLIGCTCRELLQTIQDNGGLEL